MSPAQLEAEIKALGRPSALFGHGSRGMGAGEVLAGVFSALSAAKAWDAANPGKAVVYRDLCTQLERETARVEREEREREAIERRLRKLDACGAGDRSLAAASQAQDTEALAIVKRWLADEGKVWLALCGTPGTGKSVAATWAVREAIRTGSTAAFRRTSAIAKLSGFDAGAEELEHLKNVDLLALDDFGAELLTDYARAQLFELLDARHEAYGRTILTSNLQWVGAGGMAERLGERLVDRIAEGGTRQQLAKVPSLRRRP